MGRRKIYPLFGETVQRRLKLKIHSSRTQIWSYQEFLRSIQAEADTQPSVQACRGQSKETANQVAIPPPRRKWLVSKVSTTVVVTLVSPTQHTSKALFKFVAPLGFESVSLRAEVRVET